MRRRLGTLILLLILSGFALSSGSAAPQPVRLYWNQTSLPLDTCVQRASDALKASGFTNEYNQTPFIGAFHGDYSATFFCGTDKGLIVLFVAGPDDSVSLALVASITTKFPGHR
jgi:hypothetical protein